MNTHTENQRQANPRPGKVESPQEKKKPWLAIGIFLGFLVVATVIGTRESSTEAGEEDLAAAGQPTPEKSVDPSTREVIPGVRADEIPDLKTVAASPVQPEPVVDTIPEPAEGGRANPALPIPVLETEPPALTGVYAGDDTKSRKSQKDWNLIQQTYRQSLEAMKLLNEE
jgi:hypothetical protein